MTKKIIITENNVDYQVVLDENGEEKRRYCLSLDPTIFTPKNVKDICPEYIFRYCQNKGIDDLEWYLKELKRKIEVKNNTGLTIERHPTFAETRKQFVAKYFKDIKLKKEMPYITQIDRVSAALEKMKKDRDAAPSVLAENTPSKKNK